MVKQRVKQIKFFSFLYSSILISVNEGQVVSLWFPDVMLLTCEL